MAERHVTLVWPVLGLDKRTAFQQQAPFTTYDALNVVSDGMFSERERGGSRAGVGKAFAAQLGSGNKLRLLNTVRFVTSSDVLTARLIASSNGVLYREEPLGTLASVTSTSTLIADRPISSVDRLQKLYILDHGPVLKEASDGVIGGTGDNELTSTTAGNFASGGVNDDDHFVVITAHAAVNCVQTVTINGTPTGGYFFLRDDANALTTRTEIDYNAAASAVEDALEEIYGTGNVTVSGSAGGPYTVTFGGDLAGTPIPLMLAIDAFLTGGTTPTVTIAMTTPGATTTTHAGTYNITSVATTTVTIHKSLQDLTGVEFYIARCPKVYDPVANTLTKHIQDDDADGNRKGAIPVGRAIGCAFNDRYFMAGGIHSPHTFDCSRQGDFDDWDFSQDDAGRAVSGGVDAQGRISEPITALIPHQNSCLLIGCESSLWVLRGDITSGAILNLSQTIGILSKDAWCTTPEGVLFFLSRDGLYAMSSPCGGTPQSVSRERLPQELLNIDTSAKTVLLACCPRYRQIHVWIVANSGTEPTTHWLLDYKLSRTNDGHAVAFWPIKLADEDYEPFAIHERKDAASDYSTVMLGCRDGYIRRFQHNLAQDESTAFSSYVLIGPLRGDSSPLHQGIVNELFAQIPAGSGDIDWTLYVAKQPELLSGAASAATGEWNTTGRTPSSYPRRAGNAWALKLANGESNARWELEAVGAVTLPGGRVKP